MFLLILVSSWIGFGATSASGKSVEDWKVDENLGSKRVYAEMVMSRIVAELKLIPETRTDNRNIIVFIT